MEGKDMNQDIKDTALHDHIKARIKIGRAHV